MLKINQLTAKTAAMQDLLFWRNHFRNSKARQLRDYRRYKKMWGDRDPVTCWMNGFATGLDGPLSAIEYLITREKGEFISRVMEPDKVEDDVRERLKLAGKLMRDATMSNVSWSHPALGVVVEMYYEPGNREEPPYTEIEAIYADGVTPPKDIQRLFNHDEIMDDFWKYRPDLENW